MQNDPAAVSVERLEFCILVPGHGESLMTPPPPPPGYELISKVQAVSSEGVPGFWACLAYHQQGVYGLLIYWQRNDIHMFYATEDAHHLLGLYGADWGLDLSGNCMQGEASRDQLDSKQNRCVGHTLVKEEGRQQ